MAIAQDRLKPFPGASVVEGDVDQLDFPADHFDAIVGQSLLQHLELSRSLPELYRVLRPGGRFSSWSRTYSTRRWRSSAT